ncbi:DUF6278 family protein [Streptomyces sp. TP-A0874]|uniref:DUF6278 family protein n=1 Tax=Streptomyces sp. TP-A0874 TaxID=549819 RepID=UPI000852DFC5|nr:DUF6278 family protein [Streptomyces sp. TP-A0874]
MNIPFLDNWRKRHGAATAGAEGDSPAVADLSGMASLLAECEMLRAQAAAAGIELDDSPGSLVALDQMLPRWRDDPEELPWLGNDAGFYLGTVIVQTVGGASWRLRDHGAPVVHLVCGRELEVVEVGLGWATSGAPQLSQVYAGVREG